MLPYRSRIFIIFLFLRRGRGCNGTAYGPALHSRSLYRLGLRPLHSSGAIIGRLIYMLLLLLILLLLTLLLLHAGPGWRRIVPHRLTLWLTGRRIIHRLCGWLLRLIERAPVYRSQLGLIPGRL